MPLGSETAPGSSAGLLRGSYEKEKRIETRREEGNRGEEDCSSRTGRVKRPAGGCSVTNSIKYLPLFNVNITATEYRLNLLHF